DRHQSSRPSHSPDPRNRPPAPVALYVALPRPSRAWLLHEARPTWREGRLHDSTRSEPDVWRTGGAVDCGSLAFIRRAKAFRAGRTWAGARDADGRRPSRAPRRAGHG